MVAGMPKLYKVNLTSGDDKLTDDIGFRDIRVDGTRILFNGKAVFLQGANMHAEAPVRGGRADNDQDVATIFQYLKEMNANFVRLAHYPHDERMLRAADRDGVMVWSEIPNWQRISFEKPEVYAKDAVMLKEMIRRDRNKASVILWSVSNETPNNPARTQFLTDLANQARILDPTRPITSAIIGPRANGFEMVNDDPLCNALDVVGQNEYVGWYEGAAEDADKIHWTLPQKPIIMSEFGAEALRASLQKPHPGQTRITSFLSFRSKAKQSASVVRIPNLHQPLFRQPSFWRSPNLYLSSYPDLS